MRSPSSEGSERKGDQIDPTHLRVRSISVAAWFLRVREKRTPGTPDCRFIAYSYIITAQIRVAAA